MDLLTRHLAEDGTRWAFNGTLLSPYFSAAAFLGVPGRQALQMLEAHKTAQPATGRPMAPIEDTHEVWASGVTYLRSREARKEESATADIYQKVYEAERPELFFKSCGWRVVGHGAPIRVRRDSIWNVPEPEMTLVINAEREIVGYCVGNDVSSRSIEGENPLYLPQAKIFNGCCALGPGIRLMDSDALADLAVHLRIIRQGSAAFEGDTRTSKIRRALSSLVDYLFKETAFPSGVFLMTGTGIVPPESFSLAPGDTVEITIGELTLENVVGV